MAKDSMSRDALIKICFPSNTNCKLKKQKQVGLLNISMQEYTERLMRKWSTRPTVRLQSANSDQQLIDCSIPTFEV